MAATVTVCNGLLMLTFKQIIREPHVIPLFGVFEVEDDEYDVIFDQKLNCQD